MERRQPSPNNQNDNIYGVLVRDKLIITGDQNTLYIHRKGLNTHSNRYIRWTYELSDNAAINSSVWRVAFVEEVERIGLSSFVSIRTLVSTREELEFAVKEKNAYADEDNAGFVGGLAHGNQTTLDVAFYADGIEFKPSSDTFIMARELDILQKSQLWYYDYPDHSFDQNTKLGVLWQKWNFNYNLITLIQTVKWERAIITAPCFMGMLPFARSEGSEFISSHALRSPLYKREDISVAGEPLAEMPIGHTRLLGTVGVTGSMNIPKVEGFTNNSTGMLVRQRAKNKVYTVVHRGIPTVVGDTIRVFTEYDINTHN